MDPHGKTSDAGTQKRNRKRERRQARWSNVDRSLEPSGSDLQQKIDELAGRYDLHAGASEALGTMVRLVDWNKGSNYFPDLPDHDMPVPEEFWPAAVDVLDESLSALHLGPVRDARRVADIGSGCGFPGLVLAIALPHAHVTLIEKQAAKCAFLRRAVAAIGLSNVDVVEGNVQRHSEGAGSCDLVTARKVGRPNTVLGWIAPLLAERAAVVLWVNRKRDKSEENTGAANATGLRLDAVRPVSGSKRELAMYVSG